MTRGAEGGLTRSLRCAYYDLTEVCSCQEMSEGRRRFAEGKNSINLGAQLVLLECAQQVAEHGTGADAHGVKRCKAADELDGADLARSSSVCLPRSKDCSIVSPLRTPVRYACSSSRWRAAITAASARIATDTRRPSRTPDGVSESAPASSGPMHWPLPNNTVSQPISRVHVAGGCALRTSTVTAAGAAICEPPNSTAERNAMAPPSFMSGMSAPMPSIASTTASGQPPGSRAST